MTSVKYSFLPWVRQGLAKGITAIDAISGMGGESRVTADLRVNVTTTSISGSQSVEPIPQTVGLIGPEDIIGVNGSAIIKTSPQAYDHDFEPNYLPYVEFYEEDFPWRYTPAKAVQNGSDIETSKLRPWLTLIVLKETEFVFNGITSQTLPSISVANDQFLPDPSELWAWAHVQVNQEINGVSPNTDLNDLIEGDPDKAYSRLICPRSLDPETNYHAFLVPTFKVGALVGLGEDTTSIRRLDPAWGTTGMPVELPVYFQWEFKTGVSGDFESLARQITPRYVPATFGQLSVDMQYPGHSDLNGLFDSDDGTELLRGALLPLNSSNKDHDITDGTDTFISNLVTILNTSNDQVTNDQASVTGDPIIVPPLYGQFASLQGKIDTTNGVEENWFNTLNLDPKYRLLAGLGAQIVRENQEEYMDIAWKQVGQVLEANKKLNSIALAFEASQAVFNRNITQVSDVDALALSGSAHTRVLSGSQTTFRVIADSSVPEAIFQPLFRKQTRQGTSISDLMEIDTSGIIENISSGAVIVNSASGQPGGINSMGYLTIDNSTCDGAMTANSYAGFTVTNPGANYYVGNPSSNWNLSGSAMQNAICANGNAASQMVPYSPANFNSIVIGDLANDVRVSMDPESAVMLRARNVINITDSLASPVALGNVSRIMASPDIAVPLYKPLADSYKEVFMPNLDSLPNDTVCLLKPNQKYLEAFMMGANHEFARELLWREYPTDQRGTYFKSFWRNNPVQTGTTEYDIREIHTWTKTSLLGKHSGRTASPDDQLVLAIRGDLLRKYPNTRVYAQKAKWKNGNDYLAPREIDETVEALEPLYSAHINPDVYLLGFQLSKEEAKGNEHGLGQNLNLDPGYFFVFKEILGETRFGLDASSVGSPPDIPSLSDINDFHWGLIPPPSVGSITFIKPEHLNFSINSGINFSKNSAHIARILNQQPVKIAIHASQLIN